MVICPAVAEVYDILVCLPPMQVAGASAAAGDDLATVLAKARATAHSVGSMGVATSVCTVPGSKPQEASRWEHLVCWHPQQQNHHQCIPVVGAFAMPSCDAECSLLIQHCAAGYSLERWSWDWAFMGSLGHAKGL